MRLSRVGLPLDTILSIRDICKNWAKGNVDPKNLHTNLQDLLADANPEELPKKVDQEKADNRTDLTENEDSDYEKDGDQDFPYI